MDQAMHTNEASSSLAFRFQPTRAWGALKKLIANPEDTSQVFTIIEAFSGNAPRRVLERFRRDGSGQRLLAEKPNILPLLQDRAALARMPKGSLAHAYLAFLEREGITADGLVEASESGKSGVFSDGEDNLYIGDRLRDTHDLWHAVTGYHGDIMGEAALLAFSLAQTGNPGIGLIVAAGLAKAHDPTFTKLVAQGFRAGMRAAWLPAVDWEALLSLPLDEVRRRLQVEPAPAYEPRRTFDLRASGRLQPLS